MHIEQGLFQFDLTDYHAILGVSLDADTRQIRKRYLKIARKLHPDSLLSSTDTDKQKANELLSKLVNPAYEKLTQEKEMTEHLVVLRLRGQQLSRKVASIEWQSDAAKSLTNHNNPISLYANSLQKLATAQYESLESVLSIIGQISELNLAYLINTAGSPTSMTEGESEAASNSNAASASGTTGVTTKASSPPSPKRQHEAIIESYLNRSREFAFKKDYSRAILEMRDAVRTHPTNVQCHSQLADYYLQAGQPKMAKIHLKRALEIDPENKLAKQLDEKVNKIKTAQHNSAKGSQQKSKGGLFGLFGGKQK